MRSDKDYYGHVERNLEWFLEAYVGLDDSEKDIVQQFVQDHSDHPDYDQWVKRLIEAKTMERMLNDAGALANSGRDKETFPYSFLASRMKKGSESTSLDIELDRIQRRRTDEKEIREDDEISRRLDRANVQEASMSALEHFESLTGHVVREDASEYNLAHSISDRIRSGPGHRQVLPVDRQPQPPVGKRVKRVLGKIVQPVVVAVLVVTVLQVTSYVNDSPITRRTHLTNADVTWAANGLATRGMVPGSQIEIYENYVVISDLLAAARKSVFGLFPTYRPDYLHHARFLMETANGRLSENKSPPGAALILYAKITYLLGDIDAMVPALKEAAQMDGPSATQARKMMIALDEAKLMQYP